MTKEGTARLINTLFEDDGSEEVEDGNRRKERSREEKKKKSRDTHGEEKREELHATTLFSPVCMYGYTKEPSESSFFPSAEGTIGREKREMFFKRNLN